MLEEIWADVKGYEGLYQVSTLGQVRSLDRIYEYQSSAGRNYTRLIKGRVLKQTCYLKYMGVGLAVKGVIKNCLVHRLVAEAFIPNPDNLPQVNHKDEDPSNNCVDNLEWCSASYNVNYGSRNDLVSVALKGRSKSPEQVEQMRQRMIGHVPWNKGLQTTPLVCLDAGVTFQGCTEAAKWAGDVTPEGVRYACKHHCCCNGHVYVFENEIPENIQDYVDYCYTKSLRYKHLASRPVYSLDA